MIYVRRSIGQHTGTHARRSACDRLASTSRIHKFRAPVWVVLRVGFLSSSHHRMTPKDAAGVARGAPAEPKHKSNTLITGQSGRNRTSGKTGQGAKEQEDRFQRKQGTTPLCWASNNGRASKRSNRPGHMLVVMQGVSQGNPFVPSSRESARESIGCGLRMRPGFPKRGALY